MADTIEQLYVEQELALLRADLAVSSPESYTFEEMRQISAELDSATEALDEAVRKDFQSLSQEEQRAMLMFLEELGGQEDGFWLELLGVAQS